MSDALDYHLGELSIARDPSHRGYAMPRIEPRHKAILDIGCGMGQTLIAAQLAPDVAAYGIDIDRDAIQAGQKLGYENIHLSVGSAERLEFRDSFFDLVICRVALPYTHVMQALREMHRVLKPGGDVWLALHPREMYTQRAARALKSGRWKDVAYCTYILSNGALFNATGTQLSLGGRTETYQSESGIRRALARTGFGAIRVEHGASFLAEAKRNP